MKYTVCTIILNWNGYSDTAECLDSLLKISAVKNKVIVVDNGSSNLEGDKLQKKYGNKIDVLKLDKNLGYTGGCNAGIKYANSKYHPNYYLLLNNDTEVDKNFLKFLIQTASSDPKIGMAGSVLIDYYDRKKISYSGGHVNWLLAKHVRESTPINGIKNTEIITGCSMLIKKEVLNKIGLLDNLFFAYFEDSALCLKALKVGFKNVCDSRSIVYHKEQASTGGKKSKIYTYLMSRNRILFVNKYTPFVYKAYFFVFIFLKLIFVDFIYLISNQKPRAYSYFKGYIDGIRGIGGPPKL